MSIPSAWPKQGTRGPSQAGGRCQLLFGTWWPWVHCPFLCQGWPEPLLHRKAWEERSGSAAFPGAGLATRQHLCDANIGSVEVIANATSQRRAGSAALHEHLCQAQLHVLTHLQHHSSERQRCDPLGCTWEVLSLFLVQGVAVNTFQWLLGCLSQLQPLLLGCTTRTPCRLILMT